MNRILLEVGAVALAIAAIWGLYQRGERLEAEAAAYKYSRDQALAANVDLKSRLEKADEAILGHRMEIAKLTESAKRRTTVIREIPADACLDQPVPAVVSDLLRDNGPGGGPERVPGQ